MTNGTWPPDAVQEEGWPPLTVDQFRAMFPAFADTTKFPDLMVQTWLDMGWTMTNDCWGSKRPLGQGLWTGHELYKFGPGGLTSVPPGAQYIANGLTGATNSKSVGPVSVGYDTTLTKIERAGPYNASIYGQQYFQMAMQYGTGPIQVGPAVCPPQYSGAAWAGPGYPWIPLSWG